MDAMDLLVATACRAEAHPVQPLADASRVKVTLSSGLNSSMVLEAVCWLEDAPMYTELQGKGWPSHTLGLHTNLPSLTQQVLRL